ncbi:MAG TPA: hypothetical protein VI895_09145 [Bdellovibrionota bacterium]|nr:hypothetical protein [Bdellovibrionota bacterium]
MTERMPIRRLLFVLVLLALETSALADAAAGLHLQNYARCLMVGTEYLCVVDTDYIDRLIHKPAEVDLQLFVFSAPSWRSSEDAPSPEVRIYGSTLNVWRPAELFPEGKRHGSDLCWETPLGCPTPYDVGYFSRSQKEPVQNVDRIWRDVDVRDSDPEVVRKALEATQTMAAFFPVSRASFGVWETMVNQRGNSLWFEGKWEIFVGPNCEKPGGWLSAFKASNVCLREERGGASFTIQSRCVRCAETPDLMTVSEVTRHFIDVNAFEVVFRTLAVEFPDHGKVLSDLIDTRKNYYGQLYRYLYPPQDD